MKATRRDLSWTESVATFWAALTLAVTAVTSLLLRYVIHPVKCFMPAQFEPSQVAYTNEACFQTQTIFPMNQPYHGIPRSVLNPIYLQWTPFLLGACAVFCLLPYALWRILSAFLWLDAHSLVQTIAKNRKNGSSKERQIVLRDYALLLQAGLKGGNSILALAVMGRKALVAAVIVMEMVVMATVFAPQLSGLVETGEDDDDVRRDESIWSNRPSAFPFGCYFTIRQMQNVHQYTVQCVTPLAQVYSKGLTFLFYLFLLLLILCSLDMAVLAGRLFVPGLRDITLRRHLSLAFSQSENSSDSGSSSSFMQSLGPDGRFLLSMVGDCCGPLAAADLINHLWAVFQGTPRPRAASPAVCGPASARPGAFLMTTITGDEDGGDMPAPDSEKEKTC